MINEEMLSDLALLQISFLKHMRNVRIERYAFEECLFSVNLRGVDTLSRVLTLAKCFSSLLKRGLP